MPEQQKITLNEALDRAVDRLPFFKRKAAQWKLRNTKFREGVLIELASQLMDVPEIKTLAPAFAQQASQPGTTGMTPPAQPTATQAAGEPTQAIGHHDVDHISAEFNVPIGIDIDKLAQLLDMIIKYLPAIIDLITRLFPK